MRSLVFSLPFLLVAFPTRANEGLYLGLGSGLGLYTGNSVRVNTDPNNVILSEEGSCCPQTGPSSQLRLGYNLRGYVGLEANLAGHGWNLGDNDEVGGGGFIGGAIRLHPLTFFIPTPRPYDASISLGAGYTLIGQDRAYEGYYTHYGLEAEYYLTRWLSAGLALNTYSPSYKPYRYTNYSKGRGQCVNESDSPFVWDESTLESRCQGEGPETLVIFPQLFFSLHFMTAR